MNRALQVLLFFMLGGTLAGCPAYTLSGLGGVSGREVYSLKASEPDAKLRCERESCDAVEVARPYVIDRNLPSFVIFSGVELAGAGICFANAASISSLNNSTRTAVVAGAGAVALGLFVMDLVTAVQNKQQFSRRYEAPRFTRKFNSASWSGLMIPLTLDDVVSTGSAAIPATFSARDAADRHGLAPGQRRAGPSEGKLGVMDFKLAPGTGLDVDQMRYLTDVVRGAALKAAPQLDVISRENIEGLMLAGGTDFAAKCDTLCEVDQGRMVGADIVLTGNLLKVGEQLKLSLRLHETKEGRLLGTEQAAGKNFEELDDATAGAAARLLSMLKGGGQ